MYKYLLFVFFVFLFGTIKAQSSDSAHVTIVFTGDIMAHMPNVHAAYDSVKDSFDFKPSYKFVKPFLENADIAVGNLETTFGGKPYVGYPRFSSPDDIAYALKDAGFDLLVTANNHCNDKGRAGLERTNKILDSVGIAHTGVFNNALQRENTYPYIIEKKHVRIAFLNYTYSTNGIPVEAPNVINIIDTGIIRRDIIKAKQTADYVIAIMHWGNEYERYPNKTQKNLARFMAKYGCDAIIGSHPHVVQTYESIYPTPSDSSVFMPVIYSMGNLISNQRERYKDGGVMVKLVLNVKDKPKTEKCSYLPYWVHKGMLDGKYQFYIIPVALYEANKDKIILPANADSSLVQCGSDTRELLKNLTEDTFYNTK